MRSARTHGISYLIFADNARSFYPLLTVHISFSMFPFFLLSNPLVRLLDSLAWTSLCHPIISSNYGLFGARLSLVFFNSISPTTTTLVFLFPIAGCLRQPLKI